MINYGQFRKHELYHYYIIYVHANLSFKGVNAAEKSGTMLGNAIGACSYIGSLVGGRGTGFWMTSLQ